jgi:hypothetical protein
MSDELTSVPTQGVPTFYANTAGITVSLHDMRLYLAEGTPVKVDFGANQNAEMKAQQVLFSLVACVIINPEFARNLRDTLDIAIQKYEKLFGPLRPNPTPPVELEK